MTIASAALLLFLILDPLGNVPVFLSLLRGLPPRRQRIIVARELLIALGVLMVFLWGGKYALELMHLRQESVSIAGGIVLFLIGIRMIFPPPEGLMGEIPEGEPFIVPMAIPLVAGPSGMAAVMLMPTMPMVWPPIWRTPTSKETRVRVEGFSKIKATMRPAKGWSSSVMPLGRLLRADFIAWALSIMPRRAAASVLWISRK